MSISETLRIPDAKLLDIGKIKTSKYWTNIYLLFEVDGKEIWFYYSEHIDKPERLKQISDFLDPKVCRVGMLMSIQYKLKQSNNKSFKFQIINLANYRLQN